MVRNYFLFCDIYEKDIRDFAMYCQDVQKDDDVVIHITSYGGDAFSAIAAINTIRKLQKDINVTFKAVVMGMCASAATMIALACNIIDMNANSTMMYHSALGPDKAIVEKINTIQKELLSARGLKDDYINELLGKVPSYISADDALKAGLCDNVIQSGIDMKGVQIAACMQKSRRYTMENEDAWKEKKEEEVLGEDTDETKCEGEGPDLLGMLESLADSVKRIEERIDRLESRGDDRDDEIEKKIDEVVEARARRVNAKIMSICAATPKKTVAKYDAKNDFERSKKLYGSVKLPD